MTRHDEVHPEVQEEGLQVSSHMVGLELVLMQDIGVVHWTVHLRMCTML